MKTVIDVVSYLLNKFEQMQQQEKEKAFEMLNDEKVTVADMAAQKMKALAFGKAKVVVAEYCEKELGLSEEIIYSFMRGE